MRHHYCLTVDELLKSRKSDTVFIFGSGYSLNELSETEWREMARHNTIGFNWFVRQNFIRVDYHLFREVSGSDTDPAVWKPAIKEYADLLKNSPHYENSVMVIQGGYKALNGNRLISMRLLSRDTRIFRFHNNSRSIYKPPSKNISEGLVHGTSTLIDVVNLAYSLGWKNIVLVGVDLYDRRYFWLGNEETRNCDKTRQASHKQTHNTANRLIPFLGQWRELMEREGIQLSVYNPKSLLADVMPVYSKNSLNKTE